MRTADLLDQRKRRPSRHNRALAGGDLLAPMIAGIVSVAVCVAVYFEFRRGLVPN
jgi:hypothetical protein